MNKIYFFHTFRKTLLFKYSETTFCNKCWDNINGNLFRLRYTKRLNIIYTRSDKDDKYLNYLFKNIE